MENWIQNYPEQILVVIESSPIKPRVERMGKLIWSIESINSSVHLKSAESYSDTRNFRTQLHTNYTKMRTVIATLTSYWYFLPNPTWNNSYLTTSPFGSPDFWFPLPIIGENPVLTLFPNPRSREVSKSCLKPYCGCRWLSIEPRTTTSFRLQTSVRVIKGSQNDGTTWRWWPYSVRRRRMWVHWNAEKQL